jgi:hypothetical protein
VNGWYESHFWLHALYPRLIEATLLRGAVLAQVLFEEPEKTDQIPGRAYLARVFEYNGRPTQQ